MGSLEIVIDRIYSEHEICYLNFEIDNEFEIDGIYSCVK